MTFNKFRTPKSWFYFKISVLLEKIKLYEVALIFHNMAFKEEFNMTDESFGLLQGKLKGGY